MITFETPPALIYREEKFFLWLTCEIADCDSCALVRVLTSQLMQWTSLALLLGLTGCGLLLLKVGVVLRSQGRDCSVCGGSGHSNRTHTSDCRPRNHLGYSRLTSGALRPLTSGQNVYSA